MSGDRLKQIVIALVALVFLWGAVEIFRGGFDEPTTDFALPAIAAEDADSVVFERAADTVILARVGDEWRVNGYQASASGVNDFFRVLADAPAGTSPKSITAGRAASRGSAAFTESLTSARCAPALTCRAPA